MPLMPYMYFFMDEDQKLKVLLGKRIRSLRIEKGWTQQELAEKANVSYKFLGEVERGNQNPSIGILIKIIGAFNIELMELFRFSHEISSRTELEKEMLKIIKKSSDEELRQGIMLLKALFPFSQQ